MKPWVLVLVWLVFLGLGPLLLVTGIVLTWNGWTEYRDRMAERDDWVPAEAQVISCSVRDPTNRPGSWAYNYRMQWTTADGHAHEGRSSSQTCTVGRRYRIRYDPAHPDQFDEGREHFFPTPLFLSVIGLGFTWIGVKEWWKARRATAPPAIS